MSARINVIPFPNSKSSGDQEPSDPEVVLKEILFHGVDRAGDPVLDRTNEDVQEADPCDGCERGYRLQSILGDGNIQIGGGSSVRQSIRGNGNIQICG